MEKKKIIDLCSSHKNTSMISKQWCTPFQLQNKSWNELISPIKNTKPKPSHAERNVSSCVVSKRTKYFYIITKELMMKLFTHLGEGCILQKWSFPITEDYAIPKLLNISYSFLKSRTLFKFNGGAVATYTFIHYIV